MGIKRALLIIAASMMLTAFNACGFHAKQQKPLNVAPTSIPHAQTAATQASGIVTKAAKDIRTNATNVNKELEAAANAPTTQAAKPHYTAILAGVSGFFDTATDLDQANKYIVELQTDMVNEISRETALDKIHADDTASITAQTKQIAELKSEQNKQKDLVYLLLYVFGGVLIAGGIAAFWFDVKVALPLIISGMALFAITFILQTYLIYIAIGSGVILLGSIGYMVWKWQVTPSAIAPTSETSGSGNA